jgi:Ca2+-binding RTX toxin-like protein
MAGEWTGMAQVVADFAFDIDDVDLFEIATQAVETGVVRNNPFDWFGATYDDAFIFFLDGTEDRYNWVGTDFTFNFRTGEVTGGTVGGIGFLTEDEGGDIVYYWSIRDLEIDAVAIYEAALTESRADDRALFAEMFAGDDVFDLSEADDLARGHDGDDSMDGGGGRDELYGGAGRDRISGGDGADELYGGGGNDRLDGGAGNDELVADNGRDTLTGGAGKDLLVGGTDATGDLFVFVAHSDSRAGSRDRIENFTRGADDIDLRQIDADRSEAGDQAFAFAGTTRAANSVWIVQVEGAVLVRGDITGNTTPDFEIRVDGVSTLGAGDFLL